MGDFPFLADTGSWQPNFLEWKFLAHALTAVGRARYGQNWRGDELSLFRLNPSLGAKYPEAQHRCGDIFRIIAKAATEGDLHIGLMPQKDDYGETVLPAEPTLCSAKIWDCTLTQLDRRFNYCRVNPEQLAAGERFQDFEEPSFQWIYVHVEGLTKLLYRLERDVNERRVDESEALSANQTTPETFDLQKRGRKEASFLDSGPVKVAAAIAAHFKSNPELTKLSGQMIDQFAEREKISAKDSTANARDAFHQLVRYHFKHKHQELYSRISVKAAQGAKKENR